MQIGGLRRPHREAAVVDRQIAFQESVCRLKGRNTGEAQLFDQPIWNVLHSCSTRPLACGECVGISSTPSSRRARPT
jgi:hypothetical protein